MLGSLREKKSFRIMVKQREISFVCLNLSKLAQAKPTVSEDAFTIKCFSLNTDV